MKEKTHEKEIKISNHEPHSRVIVPNLQKLVFYIPDFIFLPERPVKHVIMFEPLELYSSIRHWSRVVYKSHYMVQELS